MYGQMDCATVISVCGNSSINYSPVGIGNVNENLGGCLTTGEHNSVWYKITIATGGTLTFNLVPTDPNADYDWAIYGPNRTCGNLGAPIRCNAATVVGVGANTGLNMTSTLLSAAGGSTTPYCRYLDVLPGETYYLYLDNWVNTTNPTMAPFSLTWGGTATLASPFTDPNLAQNPFLPPGVPAANPQDPSEVPVCTTPPTYNFNSLDSGILNGNTNFEVTYHITPNDALTGSNPITGVQPVTLGFTYLYSVRYNDLANPNSTIGNCRRIGRFKFKLETFTAADDTIYACNNYYQGTGIFDLTSANIYSGTGTYTYYNTMADLTAQTNPITNPTSFLSSAPGKIYANVVNPDGCSDSAEINLQFHPTADVVDAILRECSITGSPSLGLFDLTDAGVTTIGGLTKNYYPSLTDALNNTNEIPNPTSYTAPNGFVYVKVTTSEGCFNIAKVTLFVYPPIKSTILKDVEICIDATTVLDAGPGFDAYEWSTGETTQTITVPVGQYWVNLTTGDCVSHQTVTVYPTSSPAFSSIDISDNNFSVGVVGGAPPYLYSIDNINWQSSNIFSNVPRGEFTVYIKDSFDCNPVTLPVTIPNIINVITPNGDGVNDAIDYSALAMKQGLVFDLFDRYGHRIYRADHNNGYKWDGTTNGGKKVQTGTYWYTLTWSENNNAKTPFKYSGWIMVKNRE